MCYERGLLLIAHAVERARGSNSLRKERKKVTPLCGWCGCMKTSLPSVIGG